MQGHTACRDSLATRVDRRGARARRHQLEQRREHDGLRQIERDGQLIELARRPRVRHTATTGWAA